VIEAILLFHYLLYDINGLIPEFLLPDAAGPVLRIAGHLPGHAGQCRTLDGRSPDAAGQFCCTAGHQRRACRCGAGCGRAWCKGLMLLHKPINFMLVKASIQGGAGALVPIMARAARRWPAPA
jgi:hypothetical protein